MLAGQSPTGPVTSYDLPRLAPNTRYFSRRALGWASVEEYQVLETDGTGQVVGVTYGGDPYALKLMALPFVQDGGRLSLELTQRVADVIARCDGHTATKHRRTDMFELREGGRLVGLVGPLSRADVLKLGIEHILARQTPLR